jgi:hypothetical protein
VYHCLLCPFQTGVGGMALRHAQTFWHELRSPVEGTPHMWWRTACVPPDMSRTVCGVHLCPYESAHYAKLVLHRRIVHGRPY